MHIIGVIGVQVRKVYLKISHGGHHYCFKLLSICEAILPITKITTK